MDPKRQQDAGYQTLAMAITRVMRWPSPEPGDKGKESKGVGRGLPAQAKIAWIYLALRAGGILRSLAVSAASVGDAIGGSHQAGRRALNSLAEKGLIEKPPGYRGEFTVYILDPQEAAIARLTRAESGFDQGEFPFPEDHNSPSEDAGGRGEAVKLPLEPSRHAPDLGGRSVATRRSYPLDPSPPLRACSSSARAPSTLNLPIPSNQDKGGATDLPPRSGAADRQSIEQREIDAYAEAAKRRADAAAEARLKQLSASPPAGDAATVGDALAGALGLWTKRLDRPPERVAGEAMRWLGYIRDRLRDPLLGKWPDGRRSANGEENVMRICFALAEEKILRQELDAAFAALEWHCRHRQILSRANYFMGIMQRLCLTKDLGWTSAPAKRE